MKDILTQKLIKITRIFPDTLCSRIIIIELMKSIYTV